METQTNDRRSLFGKTLDLSKSVVDGTHKVTNSAINTTVNVATVAETTSALLNEGTRMASIGLTHAMRDAYIDMRTAQVAEQVQNNKDRGISEEQLQAILAEIA